MYDLMNQEYTIRSKKPIVMLRGRDSERLRHKINVVNFTPHFWAADPNGDELDFYNRKIRLIETRLPSEVGKQRSDYDFSDEADIRFPLRVIISKKILCGYAIEDGVVIPAPDMGIPPKIGLFDLEVITPKEIMARPRDPRWPIVSFQYGSNYDDNIHLFLLNFKIPTHFKVDEFDPIVHNYKREKAMIFDIAKFISHDDPDLLSGWNSNLFDIPYLIRRAKYLHVGISHMSPHGYVALRKRRQDPRFKKKKSRKDFDIRISGRIPFDLQNAYKIFTSPEGTKESYDFKVVVKDETGYDYEDYGDRIKLLHDNDQETLADYCARDVIALKKLDEKLGMVTDHFDILRRLVGCRIDNALSNKQLIDTYALRVRERPLPTTHHQEGEKFTGAVVLTPKIGVHDNVACFDLKSLYPSLIMGYNLSPEVKDPDGRIEVGPLEDGSYVHFKRRPIGLIPKVVQHFTEEREKYRPERVRLEKLGYDEDNRDYRRAKRLETLNKFLACAVFGVMGYPGFRLYDPDVERCILHLGREQILLCERIAEEHGYETLAGDTDSIFIKLKTSVYREGLIIEDFLNDALAHYSYKRFAKYPPTVKYEYLAKRIVFKPKATKKGEPAKKCYAYWDGKVLRMKGVALKSSGMAPVARQGVKDFLHLRLRDNDVRGSLGLVRHLYYDLPNLSPYLISVPRGLQQETYETANPWADGRDWMRKNYGMMFREDKKPRLIYTKKKMLGTRCVCITEDITEWDQLDPKIIRAIDWKKMRRVLIKKKFEPFLKAMGTTWNECLSSMKQTGMEGFM